MNEEGSVLLLLLLLLLLLPLNCGCKAAKVGEPKIVVTPNILLLETGVAANSLKLGALVDAALDRSTACEVPMLEDNATALAIVLVCEIAAAFALVFASSALRLRASSSFRNPSFSPCRSNMSWIQIPKLQNSHAAVYIISNLYVYIK